MKSLAPFAVAAVAATLFLTPQAFQGSSVQAEAPARPRIIRPVADPMIKQRKLATVLPKKQVELATQRWLADDARHPAQPANLDYVIEREALKNGVDPLLIATIIKHESAGDPQAESWVGARGLMQMMPETAAEMGVRDSTDPEQNVAGGARYFGLMMETFGDPRLALAAYNAGPGAVQQYGGVPPYDETQNYVYKIYGEYERRAAEQGADADGWAS